MFEIQQVAPVSGVARVLSDLHRDGFQNPWDEASFETLLAQPGVDLWVAGEGDFDPLIGFALLRTVATEAEVLTIVVQPAHRQKGIGQALLQSVLQTLDPKVMSVFLEVAAQNQAALALYRKQGFEKIGERPKYYKNADGTMGDAIMMACKRPFS